MYVMLEFFPFPWLVGMIILVILLVMLWRRKHNPFHLFFFALFWLYLLVVVSATLFPIPIVADGGETAARQSAQYIFSRINLVPLDYARFFKLNPTYIFLREIIANILLTLPCGFGINFIAHWRARHIFWLALAVGFGIETAQLGLCLALGVYYRGVDISDALMNALGVLCGYGCFVLFSWAYRLLAGHFKLQPRGLLAYIQIVTSWKRR